MSIAFAVQFMAVMNAGTVVNSVGLALLGCRAIIEIAAFAAMASYRLRQRLYQYSSPFDNALTLQSFGCWIWVGGVLVVLLGHWLKS